MSTLRYQDITDSISQIKAEQLDENVDVGNITRQALMFGAGNPAVEKYGKYLIPAVGGGLALAALNKKPKKKTFGSFFKSAALAGLGATAAEMGKREMLLRDPNVAISPYMRPAVGGREPGLYLEQDNSGAESNQLNEDGHTDVPSSIRMCKTIMEDAHDILCALCNTDMDEEIDTWWTNKLAVSASTLNKLRDYYVHEVDHEENPDEADMEIEEQSPADPQRMTGKSGLSRPQMTATRDIPVGGGGGAPARGAGPAIYNTPPGGRRNLNPMRGFPARKAAIQSGAALGGLGAAAVTNEYLTRRSGIQEEAPLIDPKIARQAKSVGDVRMRGNIYAPAGPSSEGVYTSKGLLSIDPDYVNRVNQANISRNKELGYPSYSKSVLQRVKDFVKPGGPLAPRGYTGIIPALKKGIY